MRINKYVAFASGMSRRSADKAIDDHHVLVNGVITEAGIQVSDQDTILLDDKPLRLPEEVTTILLNKPAGYICSRNGQGGKTIYDLLPIHMHKLKPVGRLDKDSAGLLLLTNDGQLANQLTHPSFQKIKIYKVELNKKLEPLHRQMITDMGIQLEDGPSKFNLERIDQDNDKVWQVIMHEGRNRQVRRTFDALGYKVFKLHRTQFGNYELGTVKSG